MNDNLDIVKRLLELSRNQLEYSSFPKPWNEEHMFLSNHLNEARHRIELEFNEALGKAVSAYKASLKEREFGWFHAPEKLVYLRMQINQLIYAVYGNKYIHEIKFNKALGDEAYKDLIEQIDRTLLMTPLELEKHNEELNLLSRQISDEMLEKIGG